METSIQELREAKPARFVVEQRVSKTWNTGSTLTFSQPVIINLWKMDLTTGMFRVPKTATYIFILSGTTGTSRESNTVSLYLKTGLEPVKVLESIQENHYGGYRHGLSRMFVRKLNARDQIYLQVENEGGIVTGANTPITFSCFEIN